MPITTTDNGYSYLFISTMMVSSSKIIYTLDDLGTTATNIGHTPSFYGPSGNYERLVRWNFEI